MREIHLRPADLMSARNGETVVVRAADWSSGAAQRTINIPDGSTAETPDQRTRDLVREVLENNPHIDRSLIDATTVAQIVGILDWQGTPVPAGQILGTLMGR
ncbi:hypothetical protein Ade02nite_20360 [Paractinoplanes deccanensis]|uniref:Uncharacterized protein n=1 Tax=Paractinoplanes deccanensis TaxID=113561 RepID=A0ABQ3Y0L2_9ACTN|nr:hypothetical protein [Actinoplanes deccanensis]GID73395.1 hypothetical protein Ade02nite_20360 [Actinoplanes deccanensis]